MHKPVIPAHVLAPACALVWWVVGYLPWLIRGLGDDLPGVSIDSIAYDAVMIPLLSLEVMLLVLGGVVGGACAGLLTLLGDGRRETLIAASFAGVACAVLLTGVQSANAIGVHLDSEYETDKAVVLAIAGATLLGWSFGAGASFGRIPLGLAVAVLAGALPLWLGTVIDAMGIHTRSEFTRIAVQYPGAALLVVGLVLIGVRPYTRLLAWPVAVVLAWTVQPAYSAVGYLGFATQPPNSAELSDELGRGWDIFVLAMNPANAPADWILQFVVAIGLAAAISVRLEMRRGAVDDADHSPVDPSSNSRTTSM